MRGVSEPPPLDAAADPPKAGPAVACRNCGDGSPTPYCPVCGQRRDDDHLSMTGLVARAADDAFSLNGTLPRTLALLLLWPGRLTCEYVAGRIVRYVLPLRLYLLASLVFFLVLSLSGAFRLGDGVEIDVGPGADATTPSPAAPAAAGAAEAVETRHWTDGIDVNMGIPQIQALVESRKERFSTMEPREALDVVMADFREHVPIAMFFLLPAFALMLKVLYVRRGRPYMEHLVFALHGHAFVFLLFSAMLLVRNDTFNLLAGLWMMVYLWWAMLRVYGQGWLKTTAKFVLLGTAYHFLLGVTLVGALIVSVLVA